MYKSRFFLAVLICLLIIPTIRCEEPEELLKRGNKLYHEGNYTEAIETYENIVDSGFEGADLFYNLGNAYYREGKLGFAILNYERALKITPGDEDIQHNLALASAKTIDRIDTMPAFFLFQWWEALLSLLSLTGWTYVAYFLYLLILISIGLYFFDKEKKNQKIFIFSGLSVFVLLIFVVLIININLNRELNIKNGVIVEQEVAVKQSPDAKSNDAFVIHEGLKVRLEDNIDNWVKIRLKDGKIGWLPKEKLRVI